MGYAVDDGFYCKHGYFLLRLLVTKKAPHDGEAHLLKALRIDVLLQHPQG